MKKIHIFPGLVFILLIFTQMANSQDKVINIWPEDSLPCSNGIVEEDQVNEKGHLKNVQLPTLSVYLPSKRKATGAGVIICPGGAYWILAIEHEGYEVAEWFNDFGVAAFVLKYRLPTSDNVTCKQEVALKDAHRAIRLVRSKANEWELDKEKIGIMGFSAGGHLASTAGTRWDLGNYRSDDPIEQQSCRPDFQILIYPVISLDTTITNKGTKRALVGEEPHESLIRHFSNELNVTTKTPPAFLLSTYDDGVKVENSIRYFMALRKYGIPAEMHIYEKGGHGYGLNRTQEAVKTWPERCRDWMKTREIIGD
jgi:acetyl esterase/lipase